MTSKHNLSYSEVKELVDQKGYKKLEEIIFSYLTSNRTRKYSVRGLSKMPEENIETLVNLLTDYDDGVQIEAMKGLKNSKKKVRRNYDNLIYPVLAEILKSENEGLKREAFKLSNRLDEEVRVNLLINIFKEISDEVLLEEIVFNLAKVEDNEIKNNVKHYMESYIINGGKNRDWAIMALGQLRAYDKILLLRSIIKDKNEDLETRKAALFALEDVKDGRALGIILRAVEDRDLEEAAQEALSTLTLGYGYRDQLALEKDLNSEEEDLYLSAVFAMDLRDYPKKSELLLQYIEDNNSYVRDLAEWKVFLINETLG